MGFIKVFIERPIFLLMIEIFLVVLGIVGFMNLGVEQYPDVEPPVVTVTTEYPGAGPEEVETLVSKPIEEEVNQVGGIDRIVSTSREGISQVVIEFDLSEDPRQALSDVRDKVSRVRATLPEDTEEPLIQRLDFADRPILQVALTAPDAVSESLLRERADNRIKPLIQQIDGVGQVNVFGGQEREVQVELDRQKLLLWKLTPSMVATAIRKSNLNIPSGSLKEEPQTRSIRLIGEYSHVSDIGNTVVKTLPGGRSITVADLSTVRDSYKERDSYARLDNKAVVLLEVKKESDANTVDVADELDKRLARINGELEDGWQIAKVYDNSRVIRMSVADVIETLVIAAILAVVVVYFFLGSFQSTFITGISLPTVIITTFFALWMAGFTLNIMTLLGLTLAVGLLLDDAIVVRENIWTKVEAGVPPKQAAYEGTKEVFIAVIATSVTVLATFIPVAFIPGVVGKFFAAFALTVCLCVVLSTFDALSVAPTLSALMVPSDPEKAAKRPNILLRAAEAVGGVFHAGLERLLRVSIAHPGRVLIVAGIMFFTSLFLVPKIGFTFLPEDDSGEIELAIEAAPGTVIQATNEVTNKLEGYLKTIPEITMTSARVGNDLNDTNIATIYARLMPEDERDRSTQEVRAGIRQDLDNFALGQDIIVSVGRPGQSGGGGKPIQIVIEGPEVAQLNQISQRIVATASDAVPGALNLDSNLKPGRSELQIYVDRERTSAFALDSQTVGSTLRGLIEGEVAGQFREAGEEYDIRVRLPAEQRVTLGSLLDFTIPNERGEAIPLFAVTRPSKGTSPTKMIRIDQQRAVRIQGDLADGAPLGSVISELQAFVKPLLPEGYRLQFQGQAESLEDLRVGAIGAMFLGALFIYMVMAALYESLIIPFAILLTLPLAIIGAILGLFTTGKMLDVYSIIGIILLMGLVTKNAILLVDYAEQLIKNEGMPRDKALLQAGLRRFRPIMMTSIAMIAGMAPVAMGMGELNKVRAGMGIASIGGLISSTMLSMVVVPSFYIYLDRLRSFSQSIVNRIYHPKPKEKEGEKEPSPSH